MEGMLTTNGITDLLDLGLNMIERVGDCSNLERKVNPNSFLWKTVESRGDLTLQKDCLSGIARIVDDNNIQKANGSLSAMKQKLKRLLADEFLREGDVIGIARGAYEYYGIYAGNGRVIHYAGEASDFNGRVSIHEAPFEEFLKDGNDYFVGSFEGKHPIKIHSSTRFVTGSFFDSGNIKWMKNYSAKETLERAYSRLGETKYSLIKNNCEHFAMWCKTGNAESTQVKAIARYMVASGMTFGGIAENRRDIIGYLAG